MVLIKRRLAVTSAVLVTVALMLAAAPSAPASHTTEVDVQSVTLGPGGSVIVAGTVQCTEGYFFFVGTTVRQRAAQNQFNTAFAGTSGTCSSTGPQSFTTTAFGQGPFHAGPAVVQASATVCAPDFSHCAFDEDVQEVLIHT